MREVRLTIGNSTFTEAGKKKRKDATFILEALRAEVWYASITLRCLNIDASAKATRSSNGVYQRITVFCCQTVFST